VANYVIEYREKNITFLTTLLEHYFFLCLPFSPSHFCPFIYLSLLLSGSVFAPLPTVYPLLFSVIPFSGLFYPKPILCTHKLIPAPLSYSLAVSFLLRTVFYLLLYIYLLMLFLGCIQAHLYLVISLLWRVRCLIYVLHTPQLAS